MQPTEYRLDMACEQLSVPFKFLANWVLMRSKRNKHDAKATLYSDGDLCVNRLITLIYVEIQVL